MFRKTSFISSRSSSSSSPEEMPKRSSQTYGESGTVKRVKSVQANGGIDKPLVVVKEKLSRNAIKIQKLFQRIPSLVLDEIFDYLDMRHATRIGRGIPRWRKALLRTPVRNKGIASLENPTPEEKSAISLYQLKLGLTSFDDRWPSFFLMEPETISHMVFIGKMCLVASSHLSSGRLTTPPWLKKVTYARNYFGSDRLWGKITRPIEEVNFVNCVFKFYHKSFILNSSCPYWTVAAQQIEKASRKSRSVPRCSSSLSTSIEWKMNIRAPFLKVQRMHHKIKDVESDSDSLTNAHKSLDQQGHIWPYPKEQLDWLLTSLGNLFHTDLQAVKDVDLVWHKERRTDDALLIWEDHMDKLELVTEATSDGRQLKSLDLAFFGRLLVGMNKLSPLGGFRPPPLPFPDDFQILLAAR